MLKINSKNKSGSLTLLGQEVKISSKLHGQLLAEVQADSDWVVIRKQEWTFIISIRNLAQEPENSFLIFLFDTFSIVIHDEY